jgi:hypothetical protein
MARFGRLLLGFCMISSISGRDARAQWGFDGWGWGGWGWGVGTAESTELEGAAHYLMGAGMYNLNTAQANNIDAQTAMKWNDYVAQITRESARNRAIRTNSQFRRNQALYDAHQRRLRENPGRVEVENGSALNAALDDLTNPRLGRSALRAAKAPVPASLIADIPFQNAAERVTLMLDHLREAVKWPEVFEGERFANDKRTFDELVARARKEAEDDEVSPRTLRSAQGFVDELQAKVTAQPLADPLDQKEAMKFLASCSSLLGLLERPNIQPALLELKKVQDTTIGNLLGFMNAFNLRFGRPSTLKQRQAYGRLFAILDPVRNQILAEAKLDGNAVAAISAGEATEVLQKLNSGRPRGGRPQSPAPATAK